MIKIQLEDHKRLEHVIGHLVNDNDTMVEMENELRGDEAYREAQNLIDTIEGMAGEMPEFTMMEEYLDAVRTASGLEANAAYLNGIKTGFNLALYLIPGSELWQDYVWKADRHREEKETGTTPDVDGRRQQDEMDGHYYRLPPLTAGEYALVRNLLSTCPGGVWEKHYNAGQLLKKVKAGTERVFLQGGRQQPEPPRRNARQGLKEA